MVVVPMTIHAFGADGLEPDSLYLFALSSHHGSGVTFGTDDAPMDGVQGEAGPAVIEGFDLFKGIKILVTGLAGPF